MPAHPERWSRGIPTVIGVAAALAAVDLGQVAALNPGSLTAGTAAALATLYLGSATALAIPCALGIAWGGLSRPIALLRALLLATGGFFLAQEVMLRQLPPLSPWRPWAVLTLGLVAALAVLPLVRWRPGRVAGVLVAGLLIVGAVGAVRGVGGSGGRPDAAPGAAGRTVTGPNILVITIDTLRADHLSCYGYARRTSPVLETVAAEGVLFANAYAQSSWTKPSTASLLTSHYPTMHQTNLEKSKLPESETLLAEVLRDAGYTTAVLSGNPWVTPEWGFDQGVDHFFSAYDERFARVTLFMMALKRVNKLVDGHATVYNAVKRRAQRELSTTERDEVVNVEAMRWLDANRDRPFFLYLHLMSPHHPYNPPPPYDRIFNPHPVDPPVTYYPRKSYYFGEQGEPLSDAKLADMVGRYDGDILFADTVVGKLLAHLRSRDLLERTVVVITADHGEEFYDHQNWGHGQSVYNELLHVPLLVRYPAALPRGVRIAEPVMSVDIMPTLLELTGATTSSVLAGRSLVGLAQGKASDHPPEALAELLYRYGNGRALVRGTDKLIDIEVGEKQSHELYDLAADPGERRDLAAGGDVTPYETRLDALVAWAEEHRATAAEAAMTPEMEQRVKALGYVN